MMNIMMDNALQLFGDLPKNWDIKKISDLCVKTNGIQTGPFGSLLHKSDYVDVGTPIITVEHLGENRILHNDTPCVAEKDRMRLRKFWLKQGDIVFSRVGSVDRRALVRDTEEGWLFSGRCLRIRPNKEIVNAEYLSWFLGLHQIKEHIRNIAVGATMPSLNTKLLSDVPVIYPPLPTQERIAEILGSLDDKIELNRRMNATLEATARAIFKSWFVDFDPVYAKMEGRGYPLPAEVLDLFPDQLVESELGLIPKGWKVVDLNSLIRRLKVSKRYKKEEVIGLGTTPIYEQGANILMGFHNNQPDLFASSDSPKFIFGDHTCIMKYVSEPFSIGPNVIVLEGKNLSTKWVYFSACGKQKFEEYRRHWMEFKIKKTILPNKIELVNHFDKHITPFLEKIKNNEHQNSILSGIRDTLMPKLMSGDIEVN